MTVAELYEHLTQVIADGWADSKVMIEAQPLRNVTQYLTLELKPVIGMRTGMLVLSAHPPINDLAQIAQKPPEPKR